VDHSAAPVENLVAPKRQGGEVTRTKPEEASSGEVVDLLAALQRSVEAAKTGRGESSSSSLSSSSSDDAEKPAKKSSPPKKKSDTKKKSATKKPAAKKTTSKKTAAKKAS
jgi:DNA end-binding protein Ku